MNRKIFGSTITGIGMYVPENILTNFDLEKMVETTDEWIIQRTGMKERRILETGKPMYSMAVEAAMKAMEDSNIPPEDIGLIIANTTTPDYLNPSLASIVQGKIGAVHAAAFDMNAACSGLPYGIVVAQQFIKTGMYKNVLIIASEALSKVVDWKDRNTCVLFGDAAGAIMLSCSDEEDVIESDLGCDGTLGDVITIPCLYSNERDKEVRKNGNIQTLWMDGGEVFKFAVTKMVSSIKKVLKSANMMIENIKLIIPHQANIRIIENSIKKLKIEKERFYVNLEKYGNTSSATIPVALYEAYKQNIIKKGDYIILVGFGAGLTWASVLIRWGKE